MLRLLAITSLLIFTYACENDSQNPEPREHHESPKLVVGIVVDQMRPDFIYRYWDQFEEGGFKRLVNEGYTFRNAWFRHLQTSTGPGHAAQYTGATPSVHGLLGNSWYVPELDRRINVIEDIDSGHQGVGSQPGYNGEKSPNNMLTTTVGDELHLHTGQKSRTVSISRKDRGAILPGGHTGDAYWYESSTGNFITSTYYRDELPGWVQEYNQRNRAQELLTRTWEPLLDEEAFSSAREDDNPYEGTLSGMDTPTFPTDLARLVEEHDLSPGLLSVTPFSDKMLLELAREAIEGEELGARDVPDMLAIGLSAADAIGHTFGPASRQVQDHYLRLDRYLAEFLDHLDEELGRENVLVFLTSDHGAAYIPHYLRDLNIATGNPDTETNVSGTVLNQVREYMEQYYGRDFLQSFSNHNLYLDHDYMQQQGLEPEAVRKDLKRYVLTLDPVAGALTADALNSSEFTEGLRARAQYSFHQRRSGDIMLWFEPQTLTGTGTGGTSHGTPWAYDTRAPLLFYGYDVPAGQSSERVYVSDIASTVATFLNSPFPSGNIGDPLNDHMRPD